MPRVIASAVGALALMLAARRTPPALAAEVPTAVTGASAPALVHLDYRREPSAEPCVSAQQLARDVEARLGRRVFAEPPGAEFTARVRARRVGRRYVVELELFDHQQRALGRRELSTSAAHCSALDDSLALVLALAADMPQSPPPATASTPTATPSEPPPNVTPIVPLGSPLSIPAMTHAPRRGVRLRPSFGAAAGVGLVPGFAPGLELGLELRAGPFWPIEVQAAGFAQQELASSIPAKGATFAAQTLAFHVCPWTTAFGRFEGSLCAVQALVRVRAKGVGFDEEQRDEGWSLHAGAGVELSRAFGPLFIATSGTLLVPVVRRRYFFTDDTDVTLYEQPWLGGLLRLRAGTEF